MLVTEANRVLEFSFTSGVRRQDPFNDVTLDVVFTGPSREFRVPAFWAGENVWSVRFSAPEPGRWSWRSECSDTADSALHARAGAIDVTPYEGANPLLARGPLRVSADKRTLEHRDGTPFFWLGDTWWMGFTRRFSWPDDFKELAADRVAKGFTLVQIVAGLYPDMPAASPLGDNDAGQPWEEGYERINPSYFDVADLRISWLVRCGLVPCIVGAWGYHLPWLGPERMKEHWRYLIARWGAYPVVWCLAGEATMPWYLASDEEKRRDRETLRKGWTDVARFVRDTDGFHRPVTVHPTTFGRDQVTDPRLLDFEMLQTGHGGWQSVPFTVETVRAAVAREPRMPVVNSEVNYEGILEGSRQEIQRIGFWSCMLSGAAGFTYGANGIWQASSTERPYPPSPHGATWGKATWQDAMALPGSAHVGVGKRILERFDWQRFEPRQDWVSPSAGPDDWFAPYAAGIPGQCRVIYFPSAIKPWGTKNLILGLEPGLSYNATFIDPKDETVLPAGTASGDAEGRWPVPQPNVMQDWVLALQRVQ